MISFAEQKKEITPLLGWNDCIVQQLPQHGSDRRYFRLRNPANNTTVIQMVYGTEKAENAYFTDIQHFLKELNVPVPKIIVNVPKKRWIFLEDLGDISIYSLKNQLTFLQIEEIYCAVLKQCAAIYDEGNRKYQQCPLVTNPPFDYTVYKWEQEYFCENYLKLYRKEENIVSKFNIDFEHIARELSNYENRLLHRDLQSKNIMIYRNTPFFIDFQGLRRGLPEYDLASLVHDPYMDFEDKVKEMLFSYIIEIVYPHLGRKDIDVFKRIFNLCSIQRLFQALGAFCFLGLRKEKREFLEYIAVAERILLKQLISTNLFLPLQQILIR
ncbi:phosphotransferase [bacterium]|nr:phosphotransferase [bacterium]